MIMKRQNDGGAGSRLSEALGEGGGGEEAGRGIIDECDGLATGEEAGVGVAGPDDSAAAAAAAVAAVQILSLRMRILGSAAAAGAGAAGLGADGLEAARAWEQSLRARGNAIV